MNVRRYQETIELNTQISSVDTRVQKLCVKYHVRIELRIK